MKRLRLSTKKFVMAATARADPYLHTKSRGVLGTLLNENAVVQTVIDVRPVSADSILFFA
jgi:hypothetical protein